MVRWLGGPNVKEQESRAQRPILPAPVLPAADPWQQEIYPTGREVFFPPAPHPNPVYAVTLAGVVYQIDGDRKADALYYTDYRGNFVERHDWLRVNNVASTYSRRRSLAHVQGDRGDHVYHVRIDDPGERLTLSFDVSSPQRWRGSLTARVRLLPASTPSTAEVQTHLAEVSLAKELADGQRKKQIASAEQFSILVQDLSVQAQALANWEDPDFQRRYAEVHMDQLLEEAEQIRDQARPFQGQHAVVKYLEQHHPAVLRRHLGKFQALLIAERLKLEAPKEQKSVELMPPRKPKLNAEQVRQLQVWRRRRDIDDKVAIAKLEIEIEQSAKAYVAENYPDLADDERQAMVQRILEGMHEEDEHGKTL
jgi:hypothetical protein